MPVYGLFFFFSWRSTVCNSWQLNSRPPGFRLGAMILRIAVCMDQGTFDQTWSKMEFCTYSIPRMGAESHFSHKYRNRGFLLFGDWNAPFSYGKVQYIFPRFVTCLVTCIADAFSRDENDTQQEWILVIIVLFVVE